jgi:hypothetical protein
MPSVRRSSVEYLLKVITNEEYFTRWDICDRQVRNDNLSSEL